MDDGELDFSNHEIFVGDIPSSGSMNSFFDEIFNDTHTQDTAESSNKKGKNRPSGNREAVRKYREKKKACAASLEDEVVRLTALNQQLMRRVQSQVGLEAEVARQKSLLVDIRWRIDGEIRSFPYRKRHHPVGNQNWGKFGGKMELIKLSKFKLQLQTLITEVRELREKERASSNQLHDYVQKQKQSDEAFCVKIKELEAELTSSNELRQKLERKIQFLEDENYLLENKHKELKETISSILQEKDGFVKAYQESTCEMKRSIESRDRKITILSEKITAHLLSFDTIRKQASFVKQVVDNATHVVNEKEEVVSQLKMKLDKALHSEVGMLVVTVKKIQDTMTRMDEEDRASLPLIVANQEKNLDSECSTTQEGIC
uniref:BZIP domain-containing protein n=1 Tax=Lactuca sativa TaxID=4236 RepID=A0A9R1UN54_LACSA|nr:hypothetical protein LSAT_V11C800453220 [Lactuca sativa]